MFNQLTVMPAENEYKQLKEMSLIAFKSGLLPQAINSPEKALIIALKGRELGLPPMRAFSELSVIQGRPVISANLMLELCYKSPVCELINIVRTDDNACEIEACCKNGKPTRFSFSMKEADRAGLTGKQVWKQYPAAMLRARCVSIMARAMFPDALSGAIYTPEELEPAPKSRDVSPKAQIIERETHVETETKRVSEALQDVSDVSETQASDQTTDRKTDLLTHVIPFGQFKGLSIEAAKQKDPKKFYSFITWLAQQDRKSKDAVELLQVCAELTELGIPVNPARYSGG